MTHYSYNPNHTFQACACPRTINHPVQHLLRGFPFLTKPRG